MARPRLLDFLPRLQCVASAAFVRDGLKRTRMADIAREMGVSYGTLYHYVESKEALFYLVATGHGGDTVELPEQLPIRGPSPASLIPAFEKEIERVFSFDELDAALARRRVHDPGGECARIIGELYRRLESRGDGIVLLERAGEDLPEMARFFIQQRGELLAKLESWIRRRCKAGHFLPALDAVFAARFILESVGWFAYKRHNDPAPPSGAPETARETCTAMLVRALAGSD